MSRAALLRDWARLLIESLADAGVVDVVVSPGSRSTPLVWAALGCDRLRCLSVIDERDAAFWAVGSAKCSGRPVALVCTSGSAAANYFPAIVEASLSHTPLVVLTADRPFDLMHAGAAQTIDQTKLYGGFVRRFAELGHPDPSPTALRALRRTVAQAVYLATGEDAGPVHLNVRAAKPLEPPAEPVGCDPAVTSVLSEPITRAAVPARAPARETLSRFAEAAGRARRPLVVCGPIAPADGLGRRSVEGLARRLGAPVFAEATSNVRFGPSREAAVTRADAFGTLLGSPALRRALLPDLVVQIGATPTSAPYASLLDEQPSLPRFVVSPFGWHDPQGTAREIIVGDLTRSLDALSGALPDRPRPEAVAHADRVARLNDLAWGGVDAALGELPFGEAHAVRALIDSLADGALLALGNSLPVREVDLVARAREADIRVWSQRGASGIDGLVAGAAGAAAASGRPTTLLLGDVSLLHDLGGLALAATSPTPLRIVTLHNGGGRIFDQLPLGQRQDIPRSGRAFWTTPHDRTFRGVCEQFGIAYVRATTAAEAAEALGATQSGVQLIELGVDPDSARRFMEASRRHVGAIPLEEPA